MSISEINVKDIKDIIEKVQSEIDLIISNRQALLSDLSEICSSNLKKEKINLKMPEIPNFKPTAYIRQMPEFKNDDIKMDFLFSEKFKDKFKTAYASTILWQYRFTQKFCRIYSNTININSFRVM